MLVLFNVHDMSTKKWAANKRLNGEKTNIEIISHHTKGQNKHTTNKRNTSHHKPPQQSRSSWHHTPSSWHLNVLDIYKAHTTFHPVNIKMHTKLKHKGLHLSLEPPRAPRVWKLPHCKKMDKAQKNFRLWLWENGQNITMWILGNPHKQIVWMIFDIS